MNFEFHYYITALIAHKAGFTKEEAETIAVSAQFVDDNIDEFEVADKDNNEFYENFISQTVNTLKYGEKAYLIWTVFHFLPGKLDDITNIRKDDLFHWMNTTPDNEIANIIINVALKPEIENLYRIGIASHAYADTWAHQNFVGGLSQFNHLDFNPIPDYGHSNAFKNPDKVNHIWEDTRLKNQEINNNKRFISASEKLFKKYCIYIKKRSNFDNISKWTELEKEIEKLIGPPNMKIKSSLNKRLFSYKKAMEWLTPYEDKIWIKKELKPIYIADGRPDIEKTDSGKFKYKWLIDKQQSNWFKFQEAVKEHQEFAINLIAKKKGVEL